MNQELRIALSGLRRSEATEHPRRDGCPVSFIVPAFQAAATLGASIASIRAAAPVGAEIVIVDDGSLDSTPQLADELGDVVLHQACQAGAARCRNDGARVARGEVLVFVDADVTVTPEAVCGLLRHFDGGADAVFGAYEALPPPEARNAATIYKNLLHHHTHLRAAGQASTFWSGFGAVRRDAFFSVEGFDAAVTTAADIEDVHLGYRLRAAGYRTVLDPTLQVRHHKRYTVKGVIVSDVFHRAVPWTRAMFSLRTFSADLNLRRQSLFGAGVTFAIPVAAAAALWRPLPGLVSAAALSLAWLLLHRDFLAYAARVWSRRGAAYSAVLLYLYYVYGAVGTVLGAGAYVLRPGPSSVLNSLRLDRISDTRADVAVTVAVVVQAGEPCAALDGLPPVEPWWELIVCATAPVPGLREDARLVLAPLGADRGQMRHLALTASRGEMFATLDARCVPVPGWLERVRVAAAGNSLIVAGPFHHVRTGVRARAAQVVRYWQWRPERAPAWLVFHPSTNAAFRTQVARRLGGFRVDGALMLRLAGFGARPVRFDPAMGVRLVPEPGSLAFVPAAGGVARLRASTTVRYFDIGRLHRFALVGFSPVAGLIDLVRLMSEAVRERSADRRFWLALPLIALGRASAFVGRDLGLLRPELRGGVVPRAVEDLAALEDEPVTSRR